MSRPRRPGLNLDLGGLYVHLDAYATGLGPLFVRWKIGAPTKVRAADRVPGTRPEYKTPPERIDLIMDLGADKQVELTASFTDELGHAVAMPDDATVDWSVDDESIINLIENTEQADKVVAAATGEIGNGVVSVSSTFNGRTVTGDLLISVVAGDAERVMVTPGEVTEVTPDETTPPAGGGGEGGGEPTP